MGRNVFNRFLFFLMARKAAIQQEIAEGKNTIQRLTKEKAFFEKKAKEGIEEAENWQKKFKDLERSSKKAVSVEGEIVIQQQVAGKLTQFHEKFKSDIDNAKKEIEELKQNVEEQKDVIVMLMEHLTQRSLRSTTDAIVPDASRLMGISANDLPSVPTKSSESPKPKSKYQPIVSDEADPLDQELQNLVHT